MWKRIAAVSFGALAGFVCGAGLLVVSEGAGAPAVGVAASTCGGAATRFMESHLNGEGFTDSLADALNPKAMVIDMAVGGITGGAFELGGTAVQAGKNFMANRALAGLEAAGESEFGSLASEETGLACPMHSFAPQTEVLMADGTTKPIVDIKVGDRVRATDPSTGMSTPRTVTALHRNHDTELADVTVADNTGTSSTLHTTPHHPFWDQTRHAWIDAAALATGDQLRSTPDTTITVRSTTRTHASAWMYDLTVSDIHTYSVITNNHPILVHNCDLTGVGGAATSDVAKTIEVDSSRFGDAAEHMRDACGSDFCVTYDPANAAARRAANMERSGLKPMSGFDRDEAVMAVFKESESASVRYVSSSMNRGLGAYVGNQLRGLSPGDVVRFVVK